MKLKECNDNIRVLNQKNKVDIPELKVGQIYEIPNEESEVGYRQFIILNIEDYKEKHRSSNVRYYGTQSNQFFETTINNIYHYIKIGKWIEIELTSYSPIITRAISKKIMTRKDMLQKTRTFLLNQYRSYHVK